MCECAIFENNYMHKKQECIPVGCIPSAVIAISERGVSGQGWCLPRGCLPRGCLSRGVSAQGVSLPEGCLPRGLFVQGCVCHTRLLWIEWQMPVKTLPCRNYVTDGNKTVYFISKKFRILHIIVKCLASVMRSFFYRTRRSVLSLL